jgi:hypothetical protein
MFHPRVRDEGMTFAGGQENARCHGMSTFAVQVPAVR